VHRLGWTGSNFPAQQWRSASLRAGIVALTIAICLLAAPVTQAAEKGLPVPRFVTLRSNQVNVRTGPGEQYPIEWVFTRKSMPVEIVAEFQNWRKIRDVDGTEGWVYERMVAGRRTVIVRGQVRALYDEPRPDAGIVARAEPGVIATLLECQATWCRVETGGVKGWLHRDEIWGVYPDEVIQ
jgi:SH3-like domain-containing protein